MVISPKGKPKSSPGWANPVAGQCLLPRSAGFSPHGSAGLHHRDAEQCWAHVTQWQGPLHQGWCFCCRRNGPNCHICQHEGDLLDVYIGRESEGRHASIHVSGQQCSWQCRALSLMAGRRHSCWGMRLLFKEKNGTINMLGDHTSIQCTSPLASGHHFDLAEKATGSCDKRGVGGTFKIRWRKDLGRWDGQARLWRRFTLKLRPAAGLAVSFRFFKYYVIWDLKVGSDQLTIIVAKELLKVFGTLTHKCTWIFPPIFLWQGSERETWQFSLLFRQPTNGAWRTCLWTCLFHSYHPPSWK